jgi:hypothetical protein
MRKLYEATGGQPQRWEALDNLGAVKADAAGIAYRLKGIGSSLLVACTRRASPRMAGSG